MKGLTKLYQSIEWSIKSLSRILCMYLLTVAIFSFLGYYLFSDLNYETYKNSLSTSTEYYNFNNFFNSVLLTLSTYQGHSWQTVMLEYGKANPDIVPEWISPLYFIFSCFICNTIMMNLFLLGIINEYDKFHSKDENPYAKFEEIFENFEMSWNKFIGEDEDGVRIKVDNLEPLLFDIFESDYKENKSETYISELGIIK